MKWRGLREEEGNLHGLEYLATEYTQVSKSLSIDRRASILAQMSKYIQGLQTYIYVQHNFVPVIWHNLLVVLHNIVQMGEVSQ